MSGDPREILRELASLANDANRAGMARFGINVGRAHGVPVKTLRQIARSHRRDHDLAVALWQSGVHEARILATLIADPERMTEEQLDAWAAGLDSWDLCDGFCNNLVRKTPFAWAKADAWCRRDETFVRRAGFSLMANLAVHDKTAPDSDFVALLPLIEAGARDERNFVKKSVNWALRQIGKRNATLHARAVATAEKLLQRGDRPARWIARDALRELNSDKVRDRLRA